MLFIAKIVEKARFVEASAICNFIKRCPYKAHLTYQIGGHRLHLLVFIISRKLSLTNQPIGL